MISAISATEKKSRGRPKVEGVAQHLRFSRELSERIDAYIAAQPEPRPSRPEAIRRLLAEALGKPADAGTVGAG